MTLSNRRALRSAIGDELDRLDEQIRALSRSFDDIVDAAFQSNVDDEHDPEGTTIAFERAQVSALLRQAKEDRITVRDALDKLDDNTYGVCRTCHEFIGVERLMALPGADRCMRCAR